LATVKPLLKYITTIDFGQVTSTDDIAKIFADSKLEVAHHAVIRGSVDTPLQAAYLSILNV
jgi:hypothetical protein